MPTVQPVTDALQRLIRHSASDVAISHLYEVRRFLEPQAALHAAVKAALGAMRAHCDDPAAWTAADLEFHLAVASASGNPLLCRMLKSLTDSLRRDGPSAHQAMLDHLLDSKARLAKLAQPSG